MSIEKYWGDYLGGTDDSLTLLDYLLDKQKSTLTLEEIFQDTGLKHLKGNFCTSPKLHYTNTKGLTYDFYYAIDLIGDLALLMLESACKGNIALGELMATQTKDTLCLTFTESERLMMIDALAHFAEHPTLYDIYEVLSDEELQEMAEVYDSLRQELCQYSAPDGTIK